MTRLRHEAVNRIRGRRTLSTPDETERLERDRAARWLDKHDPRRRSAQPNEKGRAMHSKGGRLLIGGWRAGR